MPKRRDFKIRLRTVFDREQGDVRITEALYRVKGEARLARFPGWISVETIERTLEANDARYK